MEDGQFLSVNSNVHYIRRIGVGGFGDCESEQSGMGGSDWTDRQFTFT